MPDRRFLLPSGSLLALLLGPALLACGSPSVIPPPKTTAPSPSPTVSAAPLAPVELVDLAALQRTRQNAQLAPFFSADGAVLFEGLLGVHRFDPETGVERVIVRRPDSEWYATYSSERLLLLRTEHPFRIEALDVGTLNRRVLPLSHGSFVVSRDEKIILWQPDDGPPTLIDTATANATYTFPVRPKPAFERPALSPDGRYAFANGTLYDLETKREIWSTKNDPARISFPTLDGQTVLLAARDQTLELVELPGGISHHADVDCLDPVGTGMRSESFGGERHPWFVRSCPRGTLIVHLSRLLHSKSKRLAPTRIRGPVRTIHTESGGLVATTPSQPGKERWLAIDPAGTKPKLLAAAPPEASARSTPDVIASSRDGALHIEGDSGSCRLVSATQTRTLDGSCDRIALSPNGQFLAQASNAGLTVRRTSDLTTVFQSVATDDEESPRWLRCLELDGTLRPFETCAARVSKPLH